MWIVTEYGFFTFVTDRKNPDYLWLRARVREDLERNFPGVKVTEHPGADYLFRAKVLRKDVADRIAQMVLDGRITSHFKDEALKKAAPTQHGNRRSAYYGFWTDMAALQPYAPYSKTPRPKPVAKPWTPPNRTGQTGLPMFSGSYGSQYDWNRNPWSASSGGNAQADPPLGAVDSDPVTRLLDASSEEEFEEIWAGMSEEEREEYLDEAEENQRHREAIEEEHGGIAAAMRNDPWAQEQGWVARTGDTFLSPGEVDEGLEARNRQAYLDKKAAKKGKRRGRGRWNRHNQQGR